MPYQKIRKMRKAARHKTHDYRRRARPGTAPGTLHSFDDTVPTKITGFGYNADSTAEEVLKTAEEVLAFTKKWDTAWINIDGLGDIELLRSLGAAFSIHMLAMEDVINVHQRAKVEEYKDNLFIVTRMARFTGEKHERVLDMEQVSLFLGKNYVLSFQEREGDVLEPVRERLRHGKGRIRTAGADYLAYAVLDTIVDGYFPMLEEYSEMLDDMEEIVFANPTPDTLTRIHDLKRELLLLRRAIWPQREAVSGLTYEYGEFVREDNRAYFRDCHDHVIQLIDIAESQRERLSGLSDLYISSISYKMNEVMKVLTIIATIFIPLGFITGLYGMNFDPEASPWNMPELGSRYGYPVALAAMLTVAGGFLWYFYRKGWLFENSLADSHNDHRNGKDAD